MITNRPLLRPNTGPYPAGAKPRAVGTAVRRAMPAYNNVGLGTGNAGGSYMPTMLTDNARADQNLADQNLRAPIMRTASINQDPGFSGAIEPTRIPAGANAALPGAAQAPVAMGGAEMPMGSVPMGGTDGLDPTGGNSMGHDEGASAPFSMFSDPRTGDDWRRRLARAGMGGGSGFAGAAGFASGNARGTSVGLEGAGDFSFRGHPTFQRRAPSSRETMNQAVVQQLGPQYLPASSDPALQPTPVPMPLPSVAVTSGAAPDGYGYAKPTNPTAPAAPGGSFPGSPAPGPSMLQPPGSGLTPTPSPAPTPPPVMSGPAAPPPAPSPSPTPVTPEPKLKDGGRAGKRRAVGLADGGRLSTWEQWLAGRNALGSSNMPLTNNPNDPRLSQYFQALPRGDGEDQRYQSLHPRLGASGGEFYVNGADGQPYYQVGGIPNDPSRYLNSDPSAFTYDNEFGVLTPRSNMNLKADGLDTVMPYLVAAGLGGPAIGAAMGEAGAGVEAGTGAFDSGQFLPSDVGLGTSGAPPNSYWGMSADSGGVASDAGGAAGDGLDLSTMDSLPSPGSYADVGADPITGEPFGGATANGGGNAGAGNGFDGATAGGNGSADIFNTRNMRLAGNLINMATSRGGRSGGDVPLIPDNVGLGSSPDTGGNPLARGNAPIGANAALPAGSTFNPGPPADVSARVESGSGINIPSNGSNNGGGGNWAKSRAQYQPIEDMILKDATEAGTASKQEERAGVAAADAAQRKAQVLASLKSRAVASGGVNDGKLDEQRRLLDIEAARTDVGAQNTARRVERDSAMGKRVAAANVGLAASGQAAQMDAQANAKSIADANNQASAAIADANMRGRMADSEAQRRFAQSEAALGRGFTGSENAASRAMDTTRLNTQNQWEIGRQGIDRARVNSGITTANRAANAADQTNRGRGIASGISTARDLYGFGSDLGWFADGGRVDVGAERGSGGAMHYGRRHRLYGFPSDIGYADGGRVGLEHGAGVAKTRRGYKDGARVRVKGYDAGGAVSGPGTGTSDSVRAQLSDGEHVLNAEATELMDATQPGALDDLNRKGLMIRGVRQKMRDRMKHIGLGDDA